jgi:hypothetical protein
VQDPPVTEHVPLALLPDTVPLQLDSLLEKCIEFPLILPL